MGNGGQKYCSNECKRKFHIKQQNAVDDSIMELVKKGANSHEEIAEILKTYTYDEYNNTTLQ